MFPTVGWSMRLWQRTWRGPAYSPSHTAPRNNAPPTHHPTPPSQLYERFRPGQKPPPELGPSRDYNVDLVPKFIMVGVGGCD